MEQVSKTQRKKEALSLQTLGEQLVKLSADQLRKIDLPEDVNSAVKTAKTIKKHGPLHRQMQYIGTLMRKYDPAPVQRFLLAIEQGSHKKTAAFKKRERWRDELIAGDDLLREEILVQFPLADRREFIDLVQQARDERAKSTPSPKASRALFRYLNTVAMRP